MDQDILQFNLDLSNLQKTNKDLSTSIICLLKIRKKYSNYFNHFLILFFLALSTLKSSLPDDELKQRVEQLREEVFLFFIFFFSYYLALFSRKKKKKSNENRMKLDKRNWKV